MTQNSEEIQNLLKDILHESQLLTQSIVQLQKNQKELNKEFEQIHQDNKEFKKDLQHIHQNNKEFIKDPRYNLQESHSNYELIVDELADLQGIYKSSSSMVDAIYERSYRRALRKKYGPSRFEN